MSTPEKKHFITPGVLGATVLVVALFAYLDMSRSDVQRGGQEGQ
jgi:hypothetical protein